MRIARVLATAGLAFGLWAGIASAQDRPLKVVGPWEIAGIDPAQSGYIFSRMQVAETLVTADPTGILAPALAESWSAADDGLTWRFRIRGGAAFHDGTPVTAEAAAASLRRARAGVGPLSQAPIAEIVHDGSDVVIRLERPFAALPAFLVNFSTIVLAPASYDEAGRVTRIIGSGPYRVKALTPPLKLELEEAGGWWGGEPGIREVEYLAVGQGETRALMAESGEADLAFSMLPVSVARLKRDPDLDVRAATIPRTRLLKLNAASPFFDDVRERRALSLAVDRAGIAKAILRNPELAATQLFPPGLAGWHVPDLAPLRRDLEEARRLLAEAGWTPGSDGILQQDGRRFSPTLVTYANWPELPPIATALQAQLKEVGIDLKVSVGNSSEIVSRHQDGTLEIGLISRLYSVVPDPIGALTQDYGPKGGDWGAMGWSDPELLDIVGQLMATSDPDRQQPLRRRAAEILQDQLPGIPVTWSELAIVANKRITGVEIDPLEVNYRLASIRWAD
ncbi:ABC transporter substrate-binding protein [Inquilinus limosus]|uniref:ABC transporter substrate-binding protein n=1 Tax=Inquilinus limosus TaxID=171674 RepID=UPI0003FF4B7D|nr:ABC transporter substrate-binding protein [Inquilinus limosus]